MPVITIPLGAIKEILTTAVGKGLERKLMTDVSRNPNTQIAQVEAMIVVDLVLVLPGGDRVDCTLDMSGSLCMEGDKRYIDNREITVGVLDFHLNE